MAKKTQKTEDRFLSILRMAKALGCQRQNFDYMRKKAGFPSPNEDGLYDMVKVCKFLVSHCEKRSVLFPKAAEWLARNDNEKNADASNSEKPSASAKKDDGNNDFPTQAKIAVEIKPSDAGTLFLEQLTMFRQAVADCALAYNMAVRNGDAAQMGYLLKNWGAAFEQLRKAEESVIDIEKARGALIPADDARAAFTALCGNIRTNLLLLPSKLSHELLNQSSPKDVQSILEDEMRSILENLARNPFED